MAYVPVRIKEFDVGETVIGLIGSPDVYLTLTPTLDTSQYGAGEALFNAVELANVGRVDGGTVILQSVTVIDSDDQAAATLDIYFFDAAVTFATANNTPSISDADALKFQGLVSVAAGDWKDLGGVKVASLRGIGLMMKPTATGLYVAAVTGGTPTQSASGLKFGFGFLRS